MASFLLRIIHYLHKEGGGMQLVDGLSLKHKLFILISLVISGLLVSGAIGYYNMNKMKHNLDNLYFGSYIPTSELRKVQNYFHKDVIVTFYKVIHGKINPTEAAEKIDLTRKNILTSWDAYLYYFKRDYELAYLDYANEQVKLSTHYLEQLSSSIMTLDANELEKLSPDILLSNIRSIEKVVNTIITYENDMAQYERKNLIILYNETLYQLVALLIFIIAAAIMIMIPIFQSIQNHQDTILHAAKQLKSANKKLETASITDALTQLYNRRYFNLVYNRELTRCIREGKSLAFMMLDIDYFKGYNDTYGHLEGDAALKAVAQAMNSTLKRPSDYIFRLGGEEFGILIVNINEDKAHHMADKIRTNVQDLAIEHKSSEVSKTLTISAGVVVISPQRGIEPENILKQADINLYEAKERGRNCVVISELQKVEPSPI